jgi:hypothetical protein
VSSNARLDGFFSPREVERFLGSLPAAARPFPSHPDRRVRRITLRDLYRATLGGIDHLVATALGTAAADRRDLLAFGAGLSTSLNPFLAHNPSVVDLLGRIVPPLVEEAMDSTPDGAEDLYLLGFLQIALPLLPSAQRAASRRLLRRAATRLRHAAPSVYVSDESPLLARRRGRRRPGESPWDAWFFQVVEARFAHSLGLDLDVDAFYRRTTRELLAIPFEESSALELFNVLTHAIFGLGAYHTIPLAGVPTAGRLAGHGLRFLDWLEGHPEGDDVEVLAECADAFFKATSRGYGSHPRFGSIVAKILDSQRADGGWAPVESGGDSEALYRSYHPSWVCVDALRPLALDLLNPENCALGLV